MDSYIEHLNNSINNTSDSEFSNYLKGGGIDGGFPVVDYVKHQCDDTSIASRDIESRDIESRDIASRDIEKLLDNRRKTTPFINVVNKNNIVNRITDRGSIDVNSDSISSLYEKKNEKKKRKKKKIIGGFLNLFEKDSDNVNLPQEISIKHNSSEKKNINKDIVSNNMDSLDSIMLPNNLDVINITNKQVNKIQDGGVIDTFSDTDTISLPNNIEIVNKIQDGGVIDTFSDTDTISLPNNLEIINKIQEGGDINTFSDTDTISLPNNIEIVNKIQDGGVIDTFSDTDTISLPNNLEIINKIQEGGDIDTFSDTDTISLPNNIEIVNKIQEGGCMVAPGQAGGNIDTFSDTDTISLPNNIEIVNKIQEGGVENNPFERIQIAYDKLNETIQNISNDDDEYKKLRLEAIEEYNNERKNICDNLMDEFVQFNIQIAYDKLIKTIKDIKSKCENNDNICSIPFSDLKYEEQRVVAIKEYNAIVEDILNGFDGEKRAKLLTFTENLFDENTSKLVGHSN